MWHLELSEAGFFDPSFLQSPVKKSFIHDCKNGVPTECDRTPRPNKVLVHFIEFYTSTTTFKKSTVKFRADRCLQDSQGRRANCTMWSPLRETASFSARTRFVKEVIVAKEN